MKDLTTKQFTVELSTLKTAKSGKQYVIIKSKADEWYKDFQKRSYEKDATYTAKCEVNEWQGKISYIIQDLQEQSFAEEQNNKAAVHKSELKEKAKNGSILWQVSGKIATDIKSQEEFNTWKKMTKKVHDYLEDPISNLEEEIDTDEIPF